MRTVSEYCYNGDICPRHNEVSFQCLNLHSGIKRHGGDDETSYGWWSTTWLAWKLSVTSSWMVKVSGSSCKSFLQAFYSHSTKTKVRAEWTSFLLWVYSLSAICLTSSGICSLLIFLTSSICSFRFPGTHGNTSTTVYWEQSPLVGTYFAHFHFCFLGTWPWYSSIVGWYKHGLRSQEGLSLNVGPVVLASKPWPRSWPSCSLVSGDSPMGEEQSEMCFIHQLLNMHDNGSCSSLGINLGYCVGPGSTCPLAGFSLLVCLSASILVA